MSDFMKFIAENDSHDLVNERINTIATATCFIELNATGTSLKTLSTSFSADSCGSRLIHCNDHVKLIIGGRTRKSTCFFLQIGMDCGSSNCISKTSNSIQSNIVQYKLFKISKKYLDILYIMLHFQTI